MIQLVFLIYLYILGFGFGLCFKKWIPFNFIVLSSFLWGSILYTFTLYVLYMLGVTINATIFVIILTFLLLITGLFCVKTWDKRLEKKEWTTFLFVSLNFMLLNFIFFTFNFSRISGDSIYYINLARSIGFDGFSNSVIRSLLSYGGLIPTLHSASIHLGFDYLVSLQFSFGISFFAVFYFLCETLCFDIIENKTFSKAIAFFSTLVVICTPMIIFQLFFLHTNLTAGFFLFLGAICGWMAFKENNNFYFVFLTLSLIGANLSRTETFIYSVIAIFLLLISNKFTFKQRIIGFFPILIFQTIWFIYLYFRLSISSSILVPQATDLLDYSTLLNPLKILIMAFLMFVIMGTILSSKNEFVSTRIFPFVHKYIVILILFSLLLLTIIDSHHMILSIQWFFTNLYFLGVWGLTYWLLSILIIAKLLDHKMPLDNFLINILICIPIIIIDLSFFRPPFHLGWGDSANRLMTFGIPFGSLLLAFTLSKWLNPKPQIDSEEKVLP